MVFHLRVALYMINVRISKGRNQTQSYVKIDSQTKNGIALRVQSLFAFAESIIIFSHSQFHIDE